MKYKDYRQLTDEQKEEWMIRFQGKDVPFYVIAIFAVIGIFVGIFGMAYIITLSYDIGVYENVLPEALRFNDASQLLHVISNVFAWFSISILGVGLICSLYSVYHSVSEIFFVRKCKKINQGGNRK